MSTIYTTAVFNDDTANNGNVLVGIFTGTSSNTGEVSAANFSETSTNDGLIVNSAAFAGTSVNNGQISGVATFKDNTQNIGVIAGPVIFTGNAVNNNTVAEAIFLGNSINNATVSVSAQFADAAGNSENGVVQGYAIFADNAVNSGYIYGDADFGPGASNTLGNVTGNVGTYTQADGFFPNAYYDQGSKTAPANYQTVVHEIGSFWYKYDSSGNGALATGLYNDGTNPLPFLFNQGVKGLPIAYAEVILNSTTYYRNINNALQNGTILYTNDSLSQPAVNLNILQDLNSNGVKDRITTNNSGVVTIVNGYKFVDDVGSFWYCLGTLGIGTTIYIGDNYTEQEKVGASTIYFDTNGDNAADTVVLNSASVVASITLGTPKSGAYSDGYYVNNLINTNYTNNTPQQPLDSVLWYVYTAGIAIIAHGTYTVGNNTIFFNQGTRQSLLVSDSPDIFVNVNSGILDVTGNVDIINTLEATNGYADASLGTPIFDTEFTYNDVQYITNGTPASTIISRREITVTTSAGSVTLYASAATEGIVGGFRWYTDKYRSLPYDGEGQVDGLFYQWQGAGTYHGVANLVSKVWNGFTACDKSTSITIYTNTNVNALTIGVTLYIDGAKTTILEDGGFILDNDTHLATDISGAIDAITTCPY